MRQSQNFDKIDSFLKPVLNILILRKLIVGWAEGVFKRGLVFCIKSIDLEKMLIVGGSRIHQVKVDSIQGPFKHLTWNFLRKLFLVISR